MPTLTSRPSITRPPDVQTRVGTSTGRLSPSSRGAAGARLSAVAAVMGMADDLDAPLADRVAALLADRQHPAAARAGAAILAVTGRYAIDEEQEALAACLTIGQQRAAHRMLDDLVRTASPGTLGRHPVPCPAVVVDVSRSASSGEVTGIPRVATALGAAAAHRGYGVLRWQEGVPALRPTTDTRAERAAQRTYSRTLARLRVSGFGRPAARLIASVASPAVTAVKRRAAPGVVILGHCTYVTAEIPVPAVTRRLLPWAQVAPGIMLRTVVYDLLPLLEPRYFPDDSVARHAAFAALIARSDAVVVGSRHVAEQIPHVRRLWGGGPGGFVEVVPFGTDAATWIPRAQPPDHRPAFVVVGGLEPRKNHATVLQGLTRMAEVGLPTTLHLVGHRRPAQPMIASALGEAEAAGVRIVHHVGASDSELAGIMDACLASIYLSRAEGYGLPPVESLARGLPVVIADVPPTNEHLAHGGVVAVPSDRPDTLAEVLTRLVRDPAYADALRSAAAAAPPAASADEWAVAVLGGPSATDP